MAQQTSSLSLFDGDDWTGTTLKSHDKSWTGRGEGFSPLLQAFHCPWLSLALYIRRCGTGLLRNSLVSVEKRYNIALLLEISRKMMHRIATGKTITESINWQRKSSISRTQNELLSLVNYLPTLFPDGQQNAENAENPPAQDCGHLYSESSF